MVPEYANRNIHHWFPIVRKWVPDSAFPLYANFMAMFPNRHPQRDFFILDIQDVVPKDDMASMEHPLFSLATKPDMRHLVYQSNESKVEIVPSGVGLPTIFDKDILIFCVSQLMKRKNQGHPVGKKVRFSARELMVSTNRPTNNLSYQRLKKAFQRLVGTTFTTNIKTGGRRETRIFTLLESGSGFVFKDDDRMRLDYCEVILSDWFMRAIEAAEVVTISEEYFCIRRPLQRRLYEIARKHCGKSPKWQIGLEKLQGKTGSNAPVKKFRLNIRQIIREDDTPEYTFELTPEDLVIVRPRRVRRMVAPKIILQEWAEELARKICAEKGRDYHAVLHEWLDFAGTGEGLKNPSAAFVGFCKKKNSLR